MNNSLNLYTEDFCWWPHFKTGIKKILRRDARGPQAVVRSLVTGLKELNVDFQLNEIPEHPKIACVLNGVLTLKWATEQKKSGKISHLVCGPNTVITPFDHNNLLLSPEIDTIVVPAKWSKDWWSKLAPSISHKIVVWPAGVQDHGDLRDLQGECLIYKKNVPEDLFRYVVSSLENLGISYQVLTYGRHSRSTYLSLLKQSKFAIFLSKSESQGIALHEAWMSNVPTLVWNRGYYQYGSFRWEDNYISAPFLNSQCGMFFSNKEDFKENLKYFINKYRTFTPRIYSLENFTDSVSAKKYLEILKQFND